MYESILCLALLGQADPSHEWMLQLAEPPKPNAYQTEQEKRREEKVEVRRRQKEYARKLITERARRRTNARRYRIANRSNYPTGFAQQASAMRSAAYALHRAATAQVYGSRGRAGDCNLRRTYFYR